MNFVDSVRLPQLGLGAGYALWAVRSMAAGHGNCPALVKGFDQVFGDNGSMALHLMSAFVRLLGHQGARRIWLSPPGCCRVTGDELSIVALLSAAQARDLPSRNAHITWLLNGQSKEQVALAADYLTELFSMASLEIKTPPVDLQIIKTRTDQYVHPEAGAA